jgi:CheY-like chemotaxis protein
MGRQEIMVIEDCAGDRRLISEVIGPSEVGVSFAEDGVEALEALDRTLREKRSLPGVILLDLNLPRKNGQSVIAELKAHPVLSSIPIIVFTTSASENDVEECYSLGANCFLTKPSDLDRYVAAIQLVLSFWLHTARLPTGRAARARAQAGTPVKQ